MFLSVEAIVNRMCEIENIGAADVEFYYNLKDNKMIVKNKNYDLDIMGLLECHLSFDSYSYIQPFRYCYEFHNEEIIEIQL